MTEAPADLSAALAQAMLIAAASSLRYARALAAIAARHQATLSHAITDRPAPEPATRRAQADDLRGFLREIAEAANQEARRLALEFDTLGEAIARATEPPGPPADHRRPHKAKE